MTPEDEEQVLRQTLFALPRVLIERRPQPVLHIPDPDFPPPRLTADETIAAPVLCGVQKGVVAAYLFDDGYEVDEDEFCVECSVIYRAAQAIVEGQS